MTAVKDLNESLANPQRPWPDVHPEPSAVPNPTRNPEMRDSEREFDQALLGFTDMPINTSPSKNPNRQV